MKLKYIFSMLAGLLVMTTASCKEEVSAEVDKEPSVDNQEEASTKGASAKSTTDTPEEDAAAKAPSAYYVMFKGDGS